MTSAVPVEGIPMAHVGNPDHPATGATCEAVSDAQAAHLETLGWARTIPDEPQPVVMVADTAAGLEHDTVALEQLADEPKTDRDAPSRRSRTHGSTPEEG